MKKMEHSENKDPLPAQTKQLLATIEESQIGFCNNLQGPYGPRRCEFIQAFRLQKCSPLFRIAIDFSTIFSNIIVHNYISPTVVYTDYTASGKSLSFIEDYIRTQVLPTYANTHTNTTDTGRLTTQYREDSRYVL